MSDKKGEIRPNPSPQWVKETVALQVEMGARAGDTPVVDGEAIDREAVRMLELDDARIREDGPRKEPPVKDAPGRAEAAAKETGWTFQRGKERIVQPLRRQKMTPWVAALLHRIRTLIAPMPGTAWREQDFIYPQYASAFSQEFLAYQTRSGQYNDMPDREAQLQFTRFLEDLADKSLAVLPNWRKGWQ